MPMLLLCTWADNDQTSEHSCCTMRVTCIKMRQHCFCLIFIWPKWKCPLICCRQNVWVIILFSEKRMVAIEKRISSILLLATSTKQFKHFLCNVQFVESECIYSCHFTRKTSCFSPICCKSNSNLKRSEYIFWFKGKKI